MQESCLKSAETVGGQVVFTWIRRHLGGDRSKIATLVESWVTRSRGGRTRICVYAGIYPIFTHCGIPELGRFWLILVICGTTTAHPQTSLVSIDILTSIKFTSQR